METNVKLLIFPDIRENKIDLSEISLDGLENPDLIRQMIISGTFQPDLKSPKFGDLYLPSFLNEDLTLNLEKLELALILSIRLMDSIIKYRGLDQKTLFFLLSGFVNYFEIKGLDLSQPRKRMEELSFVRKLSESMLKNESISLADDGKEKLNDGKYKIVVFTAE